MARQQIEQVFRQLHTLIQTGQFTRTDLAFMESYLAQALKSTRKLIAQANEACDSGPSSS